MRTQQRFEIVALGVVALTLFFGNPGQSQAGILYTQPATFPPSFNSGWTSDEDGSGNGFRTYDSFSLSGTAPAVVTAVDWQGLYWDYITSGNNPVKPDTNSWTISFFANGANGPAGQLISETLPAGSVSAQFVSFTIFVGDTVPVYNFRATLPVPFLAQAGTTYWFSPLSNQSNFDPIFSWTSGTGGNGTSIQDAFGTSGSGRTVQPDDRTFSIEGTLLVPEPSSLALLTVGGLALAGWRRWRKTCLG